MNCKSCKFWWPYKGGSLTNRKGEQREDAKIGECRRHSISRTIADHGSFPSSTPEQWCGEYENL